MPQINGSVIEPQIFLVDKSFVEKIVLVPKLNYVLTEKLALGLSW